MNVTFLLEYLKILYIAVLNGPIKCRRNNLYIEFSVPFESGVTV